MDSINIFRENLRRIIKQTPGLTQKSIAAQLNISPSSLNDFLSGRINASVDRMQNICRIVQIPYDEMVRLQTDKEAQDKCKPDDEESGIRTMNDKLLDIIQHQAEEIGKLKQQIKNLESSNFTPYPREKHGSR